MAKQVLIVDDEVIIQKSLSKLLTYAGFQAVCASNAEEGMQRFEEIDATNICAVMIDIRLGVHTYGWQDIVSYIRQNQFPIRILIISGDIAVAKNTVDKNEDISFWEKPIDSFALINFLNS